MRPEDPPIVLIPGMQCDEYMFEDTISRLRKRIPGIAVSTYVLREAGLDRAVSTLLSRLEQPTILVGHSLGGTVAMAAARQRPTAVAGMALVCASPRPPRPGQVTYWENLILRARDGGLAQIVDEIVPNLVGSTARRGMPPVGPADICRRMGLTTGAAGLTAQLQIQLDRIDERPGLATFRGPVLALAAEDDCLVPAEAVMDISSSAPQGRFELMRAATHMAPLTVAENVSDVLESWLHRHFNFRDNCINPATQRVFS